MDNSIETVFDYATKEELEMLGYRLWTKEEYLVHISMDEIYGDLACLGILRGDKAFEEKYLNKIQDPEYKFWLIYRDHFQSIHYLIYCTHFNLMELHVKFFLLES